MMRCSKCGCSPELTVLYRITEKGKPGRWLCHECSHLPLDPDVRRVTRVIGGYGLPEEKP